MCRILLAFALVISGCKSAIQRVESTEIVSKVVVPVYMSKTPKPTMATFATPFLPEPFPTPTSPVRDIGKRYTAVLMGLDRDSLGWGTRSDVFIIVTGILYDDNPGRVHIIYVPRDLLVQVYNPGIPPNGEYYEDRINATYFMGGFEGVRKTIEHNFALNVNAGIATVYSQEFIEIVDTMDGVTIDPYQNFDQVCPYHDHAGAFVMSLSKDQSYDLSGEEAFCYVRQRGFGFEDRIYRTNDIILGFKRGFLPSLISGDGRMIFDHYNKFVRVDIQAGEILELLSIIPKAKGIAYFPVTLRLGTEVEYYVTENGASVLKPIVDLKQWTADTLQ